MSTYAVQGQEDKIMLNHTPSVIAISVICAFFIFVGVMKSKAEWLLNIFMRSVLGTIAIYFINNALAEAGIFLGVGINPVTVLTSGILGIPGLAAVYGIGIYNYL